MSLIKELLEANLNLSMKTVAPKKSKDLWEKWYDTIKEEKLRRNMDVTVLCINFCELTTSDVHAVLRHDPAVLRGSTPLYHTRVLVATVAYPENTHLCSHVFHAARLLVFEGANKLLPELFNTKSQEVQGLLEDIRRQSSLPILSCHAFVIAHIETACAFLAKRWSTEFVSRQTSKIRENMGHRSSRTLVRVSRLGGAKHRCCFCEHRNVS